MRETLKETRDQEESKHLNNLIRKLRGSITSRIGQGEKGIPEFDEEIEELDYSSKEHEKNI